MKKLGIIRNRTDRLANFKKETQRKKNRFHIVGKDSKEEDDIIFSIDTDHSDQSNKSGISQFADNQANIAVGVFEQARAKIRKVTQLQDLERKMGQLSKARLSCLRQKENQKYDNSITKLAGQATQLLLKAEGCLRQIKKIQPYSLVEKKILKSMETSLAGEIQVVSHSLRQQEQDYFRQVKSYEGSTVNSAIQLTPEQRQSMKSEWQSVVIEQRQEEKGQIGELVSSITRLSALYKELNQLVVAQGTIIDRIDYNLQQTEEHTIKAVIHLQGADASASSQFAQKIIRGLAVTIILLALMLGIKYMK